MHGISCRSTLVPVLFLTISFTGLGQTLSNSTLTGAYFVRHVEFTTDSSNNATDARSILGTMTFDGAGNYSFSGQQVIGTGAAATFTVTGTYFVAPSGVVSLTNPQNSTLSVNARYGTEAVVGSSTNAAGNIFDMFVAIPAPATSATPYTNQTLNANYSMVDFELTGASTAQVRVSGMSTPFEGNGNTATFAVLGHAASLSSGATQSSQEFQGTYSVSGNGTGTLAFSPASGTSTSANALLAAGTRNLYVSASGNVLLAGTPGAHDILIGVQNATTDTVSFAGRYWLGGFQADSTGTSQDYVASASVVTNAGTILETELSHSVPSVSPGAPNLFTETVTQNYAAPTNVSFTTGGSTGGNLLTAGAAFLLPGNDGTLVGFFPGEDGTGASNQPGTFGIFFAEQIPTLTGTGVFVNPQGIVNSATYAPVGDNISPGELISIYGSGLAAATVTASSLPLPTSLGGVSVSIGGTPAPLDYVSSGLIICVVPYEVTGSSATIVVTNNQTQSNSVLAGVVAATPGVISINDLGYGDGAITHANNTLVNSSSPASVGETVQMYVTGLGALSTPVSDGSGFTGVDDATTQPIVLINGVLAQVTYWGLTEDAGLYQIDFTVPPGVPNGEQRVTVAGTNAATGEVTSTVTIAVQ